MKKYKIRYKDRSFIVNANNERHAASKVVKAVKDSAEIEEGRNSFIARPKCSYKS